MLDFMGFLQISTVKLLHRFASVLDTGDNPLAKCCVGIEYTLGERLGIEP